MIRAGGIRIVTLTDAVRAMGPGRRKEERCVASTA